MVEKVKLGLRGQVVIPKSLRKKMNLETGILFEIEESDGKIVLKPYNPVAELRGIGKGVFGDSVKYQRKIRAEWKHRENRLRHQSSD